jgi:hypothetical protein
MNDAEKIKELVALVKDLWEVRKYGIPEMDMCARVVIAASYDQSECYLAGLRPIGPDGLSLTPDIIDGKVSYTRHFPKNP